MVVLVSIINWSYWDLSKTRAVWTTEVRPVTQNAGMGRLTATINHTGPSIMNRQKHSLSLTSRHWCGDSDPQSIARISLSKPMRSTWSILSTECSKVRLAARK